jgi:hypothetical protein
MKIVALLAFLCTFSEVTFANTAECELIPKASDRLACYDKAAPPFAVGESSKSVTTPDKSAASKTSAGRRDMLDAENSKLNAKLKTICRGC